MLHKKIMIVTEGLAKSRMKQMGFDYAPSIEDALSKIEEKHRKAEVIVLPLAGATLPIINNTF